MSFVLARNGQWSQGDTKLARVAMVGLFPSLAILEDALAVPGVTMDSRTIGTENTFTVLFAETARTEKGSLSVDSQKQRETGIRGRVVSISCLYKVKEEFRYTVEIATFKNTTYEQINLVFVFFGLRHLRALICPGDSVEIRGAQKFQEYFLVKEDIAAIVDFRRNDGQQHKLKIVKMFNRQFSFVCESTVSSAGTKMRILLDVSDWARHERFPISEGSEISVFNPVIYNAYVWLICRHSHLVLHSLDQTNELVSISDFATVTPLPCPTHRILAAYRALRSGPDPTMTSGIDGMCQRESTPMQTSLLKACECCSPGSSCEAAEQLSLGPVPLVLFGGDSVRTDVEICGALSITGEISDYSGKLLISFPRWQAPTLAQEPGQGETAVRVKCRKITGGVAFVSVNPSEAENATYLVTSTNAETMTARMVDLETLEIMTIEEMSLHQFLALTPLTFCTANFVPVEVKLDRGVKVRDLMLALTRACGVVLECSTVREIRRVTQCVLLVSNMRLIETSQVDASTMFDRGLAKFFDSPSNVKCVLLQEMGTSDSRIEMFIAGQCWVDLPIDAVIDATEVLAVTLTTGESYLVMLPRGRILIRDVFNIHTHSQNTSTHKIITDMSLLAAVHCAMCDEVLRPLAPCDCEAASRLSPSSTDNDCLVLKMKLVVTFEGGHRHEISDSSEIQNLLKHLQADTQPPDVLCFMRQVGGGVRHIPVRGEWMGRRVEVSNRKTEQSLRVVDPWRFLRNATMSRSRD